MRNNVVVSLVVKQTMMLSRLIVVMVFIAGSAATDLIGQTAAQRTVSIPLNQPNIQHPRNVKTDLVTFKGRSALQVTDTTAINVADGIQLVILDNTQFRDGTIEIEMAGEPKPGAESTARGFVGLAFHLNLDASSNTPRYECFYLRPTNGRADDQVRRNHATQYMSYPDRPWFKLREQFRESTKATLIWLWVNGHR